MIRSLVLMLGLAAVVSSHAQDAEETTQPSVPDLQSLQSDWWAYFEGPGVEVESRIDSFLANVGEQIAELQGANQDIGLSVLDAVRDNLSAYSALLAQEELELLELPQPKINYSLDDLLRLAAESRDAQDGATQEQLEVEREQRILDGVTRRRDLAFKDYVVAGSGDVRLVAALRLVQARSAQAIAARRLQLLTQSYERATAYAEATAERVVLASESLATTGDEAGIEELLERVATEEASVAKAQEALRSAELAATKSSRTASVSSSDPSRPR